MNLASQEVTCLKSYFTCFKALIFVILIPLLTFKSSVNLAYNYRLPQSVRFLMLTFYYISIIYILYWFFLFAI